MRLLFLVGAVGVVVIAVASYLVVFAIGFNQPPGVANQAIGQYDFVEAKKQLTEFLRQRPRSAEGHFLLSRCCRRAAREDFQAAQQHLVRADSLGWHRDECEFEMSLLDYQQTGGDPQLESILSDYLRARPAADKPLIYEALARGCMRANRLNAANAWLDRWVRDFPDDWWPRMWRAALFQYTARPQLAIDDYRVILKHRPDDPQVQRRLGLMLAVSGYNYDEAQPYLERYLDSHPEDADTLAALARCYRAAGRYQEARSLLQKLLQNDQQHADAILTLVLLDLASGQHEDALQRLDQLRASGRTFDEQAAYEGLLRLEPVTYYPHATERLEQALHLQATALRQLGRTAEAEVKLRQLVQVQSDVSDLKKSLQQRRDRPNDPQLLFRIAALYLRVGNPQAAEPWLLHLREIDPSDARVASALEICQASKGKSHIEPGAIDLLDANEHDHE